MGTLGGAGLAAAACGARTLGMEGERRASQARSSGLPAGGAGGESPGGDAPLPGSSGSSALLQAEVLDLDEDEDDLEVFSKDASLMDMNSFSPMMPTSPLSMINQVKFEDEPDLKDLFITVDEPESHVTTIETFITYRIITKTSRGEFDSSEFEVRRRYQDFLWLKEKLEEAHPTLIIPPLPEKFIVKGMVERFNDDFIETRRKALHKFLNRIADHPTLTFNEDFKVFLTAQAWELSSHKKQGPGLFSRMGQTVRAVALSMRGVKSRPEEFMEMNNFIEIFSQKINLIDKISQRIYKEQREYLDEMKEYGPIHILWSASEEDLVDSLKGVASCLDKCCKTTEERMSGLSEALLPVIHEYVLYSEMLMGVMKRRDQIQAELDSKVEALTSKKADTDLLTEEIGKLEDKVECANNALKADWERWKQNMQNDIKSAFTNMAEENIHYYEQCLATWESFLTSQTDLHLEEDSEDKL
ncbi:sorting nexin-7 isoform X1 [Hippopotamus amphibius kiboko]|uniref:sorting nexin-7 isoform X1 n=2 Tax=Hippopotamus amphibius kiboko TaxID=575201 RepID=UPI0025986FF4|nr:sorting nexin-7 isoform X1 [Hippopotamus amphibius kiboko]